MEQLNNIAEKIDGLSVRERAMVFIGFIVLTFALFDMFLLTSLENTQKKTIAEINRKNAERMTLITQLDVSIKQGQEDPEVKNVAKLQTLRSKLINVQADLESSTQNLVSPKEMAKILETVLHKTGGLRLNNLRSLGATPLIEKKETKTDEIINTDNESRLTADNLDNAYKHGLRIEFRGDYLTTLNYLRELEGLEWGFFWDGFELNVADYPDANSSIEIFTLSLKKEWIGV
jgi:MSHA biogenesis protein MshJ